MSKELVEFEDEEIIRYVKGTLELYVYDFDAEEEIADLNTDLEHMLSQQEEVTTEQLDYQTLYELFVTGREEQAINKVKQMISDVTGRIL